METPDRIAYDDPRVMALIEQSADELTLVGLERQDELSSEALIFVVDYGQL